MQASEEMRAAAATYRARGAPGDAEVADRLEAAARNAATRERTWQLAGYSAQEQTQLSEFWWRNELAFARVLRAQDAEVTTRATRQSGNRPIPLMEATRQRITPRRQPHIGVTRVGAPGEPPDIHAR